MSQNEVIWILQAGFILMGIIFEMIGVILLITETRDKKICTQCVLATIIDIQCSDSISVNDTKVISWYPVYEYRTQEKIFRKKAKIGSAKKNFYIGQKVEMYINPENPNIFYCPQEKKNSVQFIFIGIGCLMIIIAIFMSIIFTFF